MFLDSAEGVVIEVVRPGHEWVVRVHDVYWHARTRTQSDFVPDERIYVAGREGQKLLIEPLYR